ncbi:MAG: (2Fe-2S)-binding protein [Nocardioidaceae bacterium]
MQEITLTVNGRTVTATMDERTLLLEFIRDVAGLTGTHNGCLEARCGCCSVEVDGDIVKSCNVLALQVAGRRVTTVEGLSPQRVRPLEHITTQSLAGVYEPLDALGADQTTLHPLQKAFHEKHALQCGFCTPGMLMVLKDFLDDNPEPTRDEVRCAIAGNLCRCTGYQHIVDAAMAAAATMRGEAAGTQEAPVAVADPPMLDVSEVADPVDA